MTMASLLRKSFEMSPSNSLSLADHHLKEVQVRTLEAAEVEESCNINKPERKRPIIRASPHGVFSFRGPQTVYAAVYDGGTRSLCPERVLVTPLPVNGPTRPDVMSAIMAFRLDMALHSSSSSSSLCRRQQVVDFCVLVPAEDGDQNYVDHTPIRGANYIPDLNLSHPILVTEFVGEIKRQNISQFTDYVLSYLGEYGSAEQLAGYKNIMSSKTEAQIGHLDSIRIWNMLTLKGQIEKALVAKGLIEIPIGFDDLRLPPPQELLPIPQLDWKAANHANIECHLTAASNYEGNNETLSDARNYTTPYEYENRITVAKRQAMAAAGRDEEEPHPYDLPMKKPRHGGVLYINEAKALARDKAPAL